jgi:hypothetical protein
MASYYAGPEADPNYGVPDDDEESDGVWITREGERIPISGMTSSHLVNAIAYLEREANAHEMIVPDWVSDLDDNPRYQQLIAERDRRRELDGEEI